MDKKFGFGCMRLPLLNKDDQASVDLDAFEEMVDIYLERGFTYFDTAYVYHGYHSEDAVRKALVERHDRSEFELATKLPMREFESKEEMERIFNEQLVKLGVDYIDYYLLHAIVVDTYKKAEEFDSFGFCFQKKREGKIKNFGISFHGTPELLEEILTAYPSLDFVQLQINYIDWENPGVQSRRCHEIARKHGVPIIVMEPCKGGNLAVVPKKAEKLMKGYNPEASIPSWAIRFAAGLEGVFMVLSGMSDREQVLDNTSYMQNFKPLNEDERNIIGQVVDIINKDKAIPCTNCRYCEKECPQNIAIPDYFALYNNAKLSATGSFSSQFVHYSNLTATHGRASDCIECKECEGACPQHLEIVELLKDVSAKFDVTP
ncbi:MAG: aldo/keto reductase [Coriobacteriia bacterium]|nr:aldo/keto reductase [Coriobacteriia bacterium]